MLNARVYSLIALVTAGICAAIVYFDQNAQFAAFFRNMGSDAAPFIGQNISNVIFEPLALVFSNYYWAIGAGIAWPAFVLWIILMLIGMGIAFVGPAFTELDQLQ